MNIVVTGLHSAHNEGDRYLLNRSLTLLRDVFPRAHIALIANDPDSFRSWGNVIPSLTWYLKRSSPSGTATWMWSTLARAPMWMGDMLLGLRHKRIPAHLPYPLRDLVQIFLQANLVVAAPGNYLYSSGRTGFVFFLAAFHLWMAIVAEKPLYLLPQSIGPLRHVRERIFLRHILSKTRLIFLRDELSARLVASLESRRSFRAVVVPDLAFALNTLPVYQGHELLSPFRFSELKGPKLGVTVLDWQRLNSAFHGQEKYERAVASALDVFVSRYRGYAFFISSSSWPIDSRK
ncbi:MAG: polysaccharide pyruvyl transferase family protein [Ardenticatenia bacterium]|nr:polysaccharide pyruvyl transferase family protein [Ardenticatenia bacterium]